MAKLRTHRGGGFDVTLADGTHLERNWPPVTNNAAAAAVCRAHAEWHRRAAAEHEAKAARWDRAADELDPPTPPLDETAG